MSKKKRKALLSFCRCSLHTELSKGVIMIVRQDVIEMLHQFSIDGKGSKSWSLPEPPAPPAAECAAVGTDCLLPGRLGCTGSSGSLPALFGSLLLASARAPSWLASADLWSVRKLIIQFVSYIQHLYCIMCFCSFIMLVLVFYIM